MSHQKNNLYNSDKICVWKQKYAKGRINPPKNGEDSFFILHCENCDGFGSIYPDYETPIKCSKYPPENENSKLSSVLERDETYYP